ncbi:mediator of RNA polymerase II transcription subunit 27 [Trichogramma pretiosum]|uniref:mediator of RNA polymerase II transcription subunit 27 n=1 Tax=Trichogramma pretiosum TaxID=7493 RepID=UPI0006C961FD|nr:mediator of RNA polymerase II transcription subunit 27 [Trichogramma pretiosum]
MDQLHTALTSLKVLRSSVGQVFHTLANGLGSEHGEENRENKYLLELQELLTSVGANLREVEQSVNSLQAPPGPFNLGNSQYLAQETTQERQALYNTLVNSYKWTGKVHEYSDVAHQLLSQNSLKRSAIFRRSGPRRPMSSISAQPGQVDQLMASYDRLYNGMSIKIKRPYSHNAIIHVSLGHVLKTIIAFKGLMIERVVIKAYNESLDLWEESRYKVFQRVTEHANATILHYHNPNILDFTLKNFFAWLHSYISLFNNPCKRCGQYLHSGLPPTWRDHKSLDPYHYECKP